MDDEVFYKLLALGWNTKEDIFEFFKNKYNLIVSLNKKDTKLTIEYNICGKRFRSNLIKGKPIKENEIIKTILRLFRTVNGKPEGPNSEFFIFTKEWT